jgi:hypothetical protein
LARPFRFIQKKRGDRRTGSRQLGRAGQAIIFGLIFAGGGLSLGLTVANHTIPEWRINHDYAPAACVVRGKRVSTVKVERGGFRPEFLMRFTLPDGEYETWGYDGGGFIAASRDGCQAVLGQFDVDGEYACWYDPIDPSQAVLVRGYTFSAWLRLLLPLPLLVVGGGGLALIVVQWGKSAERRAAHARRGDPLAAHPDRNGESRPFPTVPDGAALTNSPGTRLRFRLPPARPGWRLWSLSAAFLVWNGVLAVLIAMALGSAGDGASRWLMLAAVTPFLTAGAWMAFILLKKIVEALRVGPTIVEISDHPWHPGGTFTAFASQAGKLRLASWRVLLVCEEEATFSQGTNKRTESRRVYERELCRRERATVNSRTPLEAECEIVVPANAMHSFESGHNRIRWQLVVTGKGDRQTTFERAFSVHIRPVARNGD